MPGSDQIPPFPGLAAFIFDAGLYATFRADDDANSLVTGIKPVDGHCVECRERSTFRREYQRNQSLTGIGDLNGINSCRWFCSRVPQHSITIFYMGIDDKVTKVGQFPSVADIANDAARTFKSVLDKNDQMELSKAIGLNAHGVGVGSFVYMRRVFERLIARRAVSASIDPAELDGRRMSEKIEVLADHLPEFLVKHKAIYGILSKGIHELSEEDCRSFYPVLLESMIMILEQDKRKHDERLRMQRLSSAINSFTPSA